MKLRETLKYSIVTSVAMCMYANPALGQADDDADGTRQLDVVIVTAQKREQNLQDVPIAITAFDEDTLNELGVNNLTDVANFTPGATVRDDRGAGQPTWVIRGVGLEDFNANNTPTAGVFYDDVYLVGNPLAGIGLFDIEQVEVLKGPQGGLYGRNTTGGAVRLVSNRPDLNEYSGYGEAQFGSWGRYGLEGAVGGPIIEDKLGFRLAAMAEQGGGWQDSLVTPEDDEHGDRDFLAAKGQLLFAPTPKLDLLLKVDAGYDRSETVLARVIGTYTLDGTGFNGDPTQTCAPILAGNRDDAACATYASRFVPNALSPSLQSDNGETVISEPVNELDNDWIGVTFDASYDLGFAEFRSISSYIDYTYFQIFDFDATELDLSDSSEEFPNTDATIEQWSQEFRLVSSTDGPLSWILGAMYATDTKTQLAWFDFSDAVANPANLGITRAASDIEQETDHWAIYASGDFDISPTLNLNGSIRYTDETQDYTYVSLITFADFASDLFGLPPGEVWRLVPDQLGLITGVPDGRPNEMLETELEEQVSGHIGINWTPADNVLLYAKYSRGFKSGGFYGAAATTIDEVLPYPEETNDAFEIGVKSQLWDQLQVNAALYHYQYSDAQGLVDVENTLDPTSSLTILQTLGDAEHTGLEVDVLWQPPQVPGLTLQAAGAWIDAEITDTDQVTEDLFGNQFSLEGFGRTYAPEFSYTTNAQYDFQLTDSIVGRVGGVYTWTDDLRPRDTFPADSDFGAEKIESYGLLDLRVAIANEQAGWEVALLGQNVTDETYFVGTSSSLGSFFQTPGRPANWTIRLRQDF